MEANVEAIDIYRMVEDQVIMDFGQKIALRIPTVYQVLDRKKATLSSRE